MFIEKLLAKTYVVLDSLAGVRHFNEVKEQSKPSVLKMVTNQNQVLSIEVTRKHYVLEKPGWWFFKKKYFYVYQVKCLTADGFPDDFCKVFQMPIYIPRLLNKLAGEERQLNALISAFLDLKNHELNDKIN